MPSKFVLEIFQSTWAMERRHPDYPEWTFSEQCKMVSEAGFNGLNIDLDTQFMPGLAEIRDILKRSQLRCSVVAFPSTIDDLKRSLEKSVQLDATSLVVNARFFPFTPQQAVGFVEQSIHAGLEYGIPVHFETHRYTLTNDLLFTVQLLELCPSMRLVADLSHYVVGREIPFPVDSFHQELISRILARSVSIQGRIASREQIQVPVHFQRHLVWVSQFYDWWEQGITSWLLNAEQGDVFNFTSELGPPDYALTDENGYELSSRWQESLIFKNEIERIWQRAQC
jgi:hypothetical protein